MQEPSYLSDISALAADLRHAHGMNAVDVAVDTLQHHLQKAAWKHCAMWLRVINQLQTAKARSL